MICSAQALHQPGILTIRSELENLLFKDKKALFNWNDENLIDELEAAQTLVWLEGDEVCAFLCYRTAGDAYEISVLATHPKWQRRSLQQKLLAEVKRRAQLESKAIWLEVHENNHQALSFYMKEAFRQTGMRKGYYSDGGTALLMSYP